MAVLFRIRPVFIFVLLFSTSTANRSVLDENTEMDPVKWWVSSFEFPRALEPRLIYFYKVV
jgi:hypothetical protein